MSTDRLNRYLSRAAGVSRRTADEMIRKGRVTLAGKPAQDPGTLLDPSRSEVRIDGNRILAVEEEKIYLLAYKPDSVVTTMKDKEGRKTAASLVGELSSRVFPVGRLDYHTTGLLLFTNDPVASECRIRDPKILSPGTMHFSVWPFPSTCSRSLSLSR